MSDVAQKLAQLSPEQRARVFAALNRKKQQKQPEGALMPSQPRVAGKESRFPLSFAQQRLWLLDQIDPNNPFYNISRAFFLSGPLQVMALQRAFQALGQRHETLRTAFVVTDDDPVQVIAPAVTLALPVESLAELPVAEREAAALALAQEEARRPFDLREAPLLRVRLLALGEVEGGVEKHVLLMTMHHIISDGWSLTVLYKEVAALYEAFCQGEVMPLRPLAVQYADFAVWQRRKLSGVYLQKQLDYWRHRLAHVPILQLPTDWPRPVMQTFRGKLVMFQLPSALYAALRALCRQEEVTPFMVLMASLQTLLYHYTYQEDVAVGMPIANRKQAEIAPLIGFFVNTLVIRSDLSDTPTFRSLFHQVRRAALEAYAHQDVPFEMLVEALQPARDTSYTPLFQVMLGWHNLPPGQLDLAEVSVQRLKVHNGRSRFDLTLELWPEGEVIHGLCEYSTDLFEDATIERLLAHFEQTLRQAVQQPETRIDQLVLLTEAEKQTLTSWNNTAVTWPDEPACVHHLFEVQAVMMPAALAVSFEADYLTYAELNNRANQLACHLRGMGIGPGQLVGIHLQRGLLMPVAVLAVLKAGAAYVPLAPNYPTERLNFMLQDAQVTVLLTEQALRVEGVGAGCEVVLLDAFLWSAASVANPLTAVTSDDPVYVIYTSGSTGQPKGVVMPHGAAMNMLQWQMADSACGVGNKTLQFAPLSFDVSFQEMFATWGTGGTLVLIDETTRLDPGRLLSFLAMMGVERLFLPFVALQHVAEAACEQPRALPQLKEVITAGEQLYITPAVAAWFTGMPACRLQNQYGPTESHVVTAYNLRGTVTEWPLRPPIGRPIANTAVYILNAAGEVVPIGVPGELYIAGRNVAQGYWQQLGLTAERFVSLPSLPDVLLYKTGDLARWLPDGNLVFLGRVDTQTKIRGYRVELGEVEVALNEHEVVQDCVVSVFGEEAATRVLVAYVVATEVVPVAEWQQFLRERLPGYMVPTHFVRLQDLPLTPSGKVNRRVLPPPNKADMATAVSFAAPQTPTQLAVAEIWQEVLGVPRIGLYDNFFDLGGHSLLAAKVIARVQRQFNLNVPLRLLFEAPGVAAFTQAIEQYRQEEMAAISTASLFFEEELEEGSL